LVQILLILGLEDLLAGLPLLFILRGRALQALDGVILFLKVLIL
jgi:hypothetical protein